MEKLKSGSAHQNFKDQGISYIVERVEQTWLGQALRLSLRGVEN